MNVFSDSDNADHQPPGVPGIDMRPEQLDPQSTVLPDPPLLLDCDLDVSLNESIVNDEIGVLREATIDNDLVDNFDEENLGKMFTVL